MASFLLRVAIKQLPVAFPTNTHPRSVRAFDRSVQRSSTNIYAVCDAMTLCCTLCSVRAFEHGVTRGDQPAERLFKPAAHTGWRASQPNPHAHAVVKLSCGCCKAVMLLFRCSTRIKPTLVSAPASIQGHWATPACI